MRPTPEYETSVVIAGQEYHAQTAELRAPIWPLGSCVGCAFDAVRGCIAPLPHVDMPCVGRHRADNTSIVWVKA